MNPIPKFLLVFFAIFTVAYAALKVVPDPVWHPLSKVPTRLAITKDTNQPRITVDSIPMFLAVANPPNVEVSVNPAWVQADYEAQVESCGDQVRVIVTARTALAKKELLRTFAHE